VCVSYCLPEAKEKAENSGEHRRRQIELGTEEVEEQTNRQRVAKQRTGHQRAELDDNTFAPAHPDGVYPTTTTKKQNKIRNKSKREPHLLLKSEKRKAITIPVCDESKQIESFDKIARNVKGG
jgi:hypothetical protein